MPMWYVGAEWALSSKGDSGYMFFTVDKKTQGFYVQEGDPVQDAVLPFLSMDPFFPELASVSMVRYLLGGPML